MLDEAEFNRWLELRGLSTPLGTMLEQASKTGLASRLAKLLGKR